jgi:methionine-rich copper-binding protein CopC
MIRGSSLTLALLLAASPAFAHAFLERARPAVGSEIPASPPAVVITYTEGVEPHFSQIEVHDASGARVDQNDVHTDGEQTKLAVSLPKLPPGVYTVTWHVTSVDTHKTEGQFTFTVAP